MTNLENLLRASLQENTPPAEPDDSLAVRVAATGHRRQRARRAGVAAVALVAVAGIAWGSIALPRPGQPAVPAAPPSVQATAGTPSPSESIPAPPAADASVRDVSGLGSWTQVGDLRFRTNSFASPTGTFRCFLGTAGAGCLATPPAPDVKPVEGGCGDTPISGPDVWGTAPATWGCHGDPQAFPYLGDPEYADFVAWWDADFGDSVRVPGMPPATLAVLPNGKSLVAGDFRCSMANDAVTCRNTRTGHGFFASRSELNLKP